MILKAIHTKTRIYYLQDNKFIDVDRFNNIISNWEFMGYDIKQYTMRCKNRDITIIYRKGIDKN